MVLTPNVTLGGNLTYFVSKYVCVTFHHVNLIEPNIENGFFQKCVRNLFNVKNIILFQKRNIFLMKCVYFKSNFLFCLGK